MKSPTKITTQEAKVTKKEWGAIFLLILLSNAVTLFVTSKVLVQKPKTVDLVGILEDERRADLQKVLDGKMTQDEFVSKHKGIANKVETFINDQGGTILVKQCVLGSAHEDITPLVKATIAE